MTKKVKVTGPEAVGLDFLLKLSKNDIDEACVRLGAVVYNENAVLNGESLEIVEPLRFSNRHMTLFNALQYGYEIEDEYKVGDWVVWETEHERHVLQIDRVSTLRDGKKVFGEEGFWMEYIKRHATPEEIKAEKERGVWAKIGRKPREFREYDVAKTKNGSYNPLIGEGGIEAAKRFYDTGDLDGFYPAESFISFGGGE